MVTIATETCSQPVVTMVTIATETCSQPVVTMVTIATETCSQPVVTMVTIATETCIQSIKMTTSLLNVKTMTLIDVLINYHSAGKRDRDLTPSPYIMLDGPKGQEP